MDLGAGRRGTDMGPSALRLARLGETLSRLGTRVYDHGNVEVSVAEFFTPEDVGDENARYARRIVQACRLALSQLRERQPGELPLTLGGDHSISMASVAGAFQGPAQCSAVIWVDAHADLNTPSTSPSGNIHGMPLAHLLGLGESRIRDIWGGGAVLNPEALVYIGLRSVDPAERELIHDLGIRAYSMTDIDRMGMAAVAAETTEYLQGHAGWHVSFDADALDPSLAPGVGTPVPGGLTYREAHLLMESLHQAGRVASADLVEVNPVLDERNSTATTLVGLAASLLGKRIL